MTRAPFIKQRIHRMIQTQGVASTPTLVTLKWLEYGAGGIVDAVSRATVGGDEIEHELGVAALIYSLPPVSVQRQLAEYQEGDLLLDLPADLDLSDKAQLTFVVGGVEYTSAKIPGVTSVAQDVQFAGLTFSQMVHLRRAS
jgi:hypothetical protein